MNNKKRGFFEKLTGAINTNELEERVEEDNDLEIKEKDPEWEKDEGEAQLTVDVYQTADEIVIKTMVAGVDPDTLDIQISRDMVTIQGTRHEGKTTADDNYFHQELYWGSFSRTILLPAEVEVEESEAMEEHGLLTLRLPKIDKDRKTKLKVKTK